MGLGILEDKHLKHVPGTSVFSKDPNAVAAAAFEGVDLSLLKHGKGKHSHIILVPQPSDDPNDPLNWPLWKKHANFLVLTYGTVLCGALGPLLSAGQVDLAAEFGVSLSAISRALGTSLVVALAFATVVWSALATKVGKRPVFIAGTVFMLVGVIMAGQAQNYGTLLGSRIIQGIGQAVCEFLVGSSLADLYFVHERGWPTAIWTISLLNVTPPIAGSVYENLGWRWCWHIFAIATGILLLIQIVFMPETTYNRSAPIPRSNSVAEVGEEKHDMDHVERGTTASAAKPMKSLVQEMRVYNGIFSRDRSFVHLLWEPFAMLASPVVLFAIFTYGLAITFLVVIATGAAQVFVGTYGFGTAAVGNTYVAALIADFIAAVLVGPLTDYIAAYLSRRNGGIFEPEFRLPLIAFYAVFGGMGLYGFGIVAGNGGNSWGAIIFFAILNFGITIGCHCVIVYVVDCHPRESDAALGAVIFGKNALSAIFTAFTNIWLGWSIEYAFVIMGCLAVGTSALAIPMYIWGKRTRSWLTRTLHVEKEQKTLVTS
ncbi:hypothetical protein JCM10207_005250 [Rhodosporidiobolus poonsookiae]